MMKRTIAFSGTHSSGKTTMLNEVKRILDGAGHFVFTCHNVARYCPFKLNKDASYATQEWILDNQIRVDKDGRESDYDVILSERTVLDNIAYAYWLLMNGKITVDEYHGLRGKAKAYLQNNRYDMVFLLSPLPLVLDGVRDPDQGYQYQIHGIISEQLNSTLLFPFRYVGNGSTDSRLDIVRSTLNSLYSWNLDKNSSNSIHSSETSGLPTSAP